jgi:outer membrane protein
VNARVALVTAQRDRALASGTVLAATGALSGTSARAESRGLRPVVHYQQVRDNWGGLRTPDGR